MPGLGETVYNSRSNDSKTLFYVCASTLEQFGGLLIMAKNKAALADPTRLAVRFSRQTDASGCYRNSQGKPEQVCLQYRRSHFSS
jgi:hypothetical protein